MLSDYISKVLNKLNTLDYEIERNKYNFKQEFSDDSILVSQQSNSGDLRQRKKQISIQEQQPYSSHDKLDIGQQQQSNDEPDLNLRMINLQGVVFKVQQETLNKFPFSDFKGMLSGRLPAESKEGVVFIDKSPQVFEKILKLINCDKYMQVSRDLAKDLPFFGLRLNDFNKNVI